MTAERKFLRSLSAPNQRPRSARASDASDAQGTHTRVARSPRAGGLGAHRRRVDEAIILDYLRGQYRLAGS
jgi:hypothetical protein